MPHLRGDAPNWRRHVVSEYDYAFDLARIKLQVPVPGARLYMVFDGRFKYIHADGFAPMLYDLGTDPQELTDLGQHPAHAETRSRLYEALARWSRTTRTQTTVSDAEIAAHDEATLAYDPLIGPGVLIGYWDEEELAREREKREAYRLARAAADRRQG